MVDVLIIGAGLYGATCAYKLKEQGFSVLVIDKRPHIAGNCYSENRNGIDIHIYGPHIFHTDNTEVWEFVNKFSNFEQFQLNIIANNNDKLYHLPFNLTTMYELFGTYDVEKIQQTIENEINTSGICNSQITNLEEQAISQVGTTIYNTLVKGYTEKQWGTTCNKLSPDIIKRLPVRYNFDNNYFNDKYQGIPENGYTAMVSNMLKGIPVILGVDVNDQLDYWYTQAKHIIYCGAPDKLMNYELGELDWRALDFDHRFDEINSLQGCPIMNFTSSDVSYTRITEHKWFKPHNAPMGVTYWTYERPTKYDRFSICDPFYSVNNEKSNKLYREYVNLIKTKYPNIHLGGRLGKYQYFDMDDTINEALTDVKEITLQLL